MNPQPDSPTIILADDHEIFRQGLVALVQARTPYRFLGEASDGESAWKLLQENQPDLAVFDHSMPERKGLDVVELARDAGHPTRVVLLTQHRHSTIVEEARRAGAAACVLKDDAFEDLVAALASALAGAFYSSRTLTKTLNEAEDPQTLSTREKEIVRGIIKGQTNKELAVALGISVKTIENHRMRIMKKMGAHNTADIVRTGLDMGV